MILIEFWKRHQPENNFLKRYGSYLQCAFEPSIVVPRKKGDNTLSPENPIVPCHICCSSYWRTTWQWGTFPKNNRSDSIPKWLLKMEFKYFESQLLHVTAIVLPVPYIYSYIVFLPKIICLRVFRDIWKSWNSNIKRSNYSSKQPLLLFPKI